MAYDDIRISELPTLPELHVNDLFLIQDVTNGLAHNIDWNRLKNSIGTLANGITFPLGTVQEPQIAVGDYTSGIYGDDFGTFNIATHGYKRIGINQSGTIELVNGNVLIGGYDRQCEYSLIVNNVTRFNCRTVVQDDLEIGGDLDVAGDIQGGNSLEVPGDVVLPNGSPDPLRRGQSAYRLIQKNRDYISSRATACDISRLIGRYLKSLLMTIFLAISSK